MIKPKSQSFRVKVMLIKLEAVTNRVATRCQASLKIDGEEQLFKASPELKKNVALFNSEVEIQHFSIQVDEVTGLYQSKQALLLIDIETQGTKMRMGEVSINLGGILNEKKYRIVSQYPLNKCYDKTAKVRVSVDFIPSSGSEGQISQKKETREFKSSNVMLSKDISEPFLSPFGEKRTPNIKSRLAEESNFILQEKIYEYEQKMDNYRMSQTQLQEKMNEQISSKDEQISELTLEVNRKAQQLSVATLENEKLRFRIKQQGEEVESLKEQKRSLLLMIQNLQQGEQASRKEISALKTSLENVGKTKESKEKYYSQEVAKYTARYLESQQERNKIIFELQTKFKEEMQKKENNYRVVMTTAEKKYQQSAHQFREKTKKIEQALAAEEEKLEQAYAEIKKYKDALHHREKQEHAIKARFNELLGDHDQLKKINTETSHQLQTLNFSYNEMDRDLEKAKEEVQSLKKTNEQLKMELIIANQTIEEQYKTITKNNRELQVHHEREYYLTQKYTDEMEIKSINEENIRGESLYYRDEIHKLKGKLKMAEERAEEEASKASELSDSLHRLDNELANRGQGLMRLGEEKLTLQNQLKMVRSELSDMEEAVLILKEENLQMSDMLREKRDALENDKSLQWTYKIEELQNDICEMVEKFRVQKEAMRDSFRREEAKKKEQLSSTSLALRKARDEAEEVKKQNQRHEAALRQLQKGVEQLKSQIKIKNKSYEEAIEKIRAANLEREELEKKIKTAESICEGKVKDAESKVGKETAQLKKLELGRTANQKIIQLLLQYLTRPLQSVVGFQEIMIPEAEGQFINLVNLSLRKHCEERAKVREQLKKAESLPFGEKTETRTVEIEALRSKQKHYTMESQEKSSKICQNNSVAWKNQPKSSFNEMEDTREENSRLKREISELKNKIRSIEEDVARAERAVDLERSERNDVRHELEEAQDEVDKLSFQIKRKDKLLIEYENQIRELQGEVVSLRTSQSQPKTQPAVFSRVEARLREKEETTSNNRRQIVIRDLEAKLQAKTKELEEVVGESSKVRGDNSGLRETVAHLSNQLKLLDSKYKDRCSKFSIQQSQYLQGRSKLQDDLHRQSLRHKQQLQSLAEELLKVQDESIYHQRVGEQLRKEVEELQKKQKNMRDEFKATDLKNKRQYQSGLNRLKENNNELEGTVAQLKSELEQMQLRTKEEAMRSGSQTALLAKRTEEIDRLGGLLRDKEKIIFELEEQIQMMQAQHQARTEELKEMIEQFEEDKLKREYELEEFKFTSEGRILDLERRLEDVGVKAT